MAQLEAGQAVPLPPKPIKWMIILNEISTHNATHNETSDQNRVNQGLLLLIHAIEPQNAGPGPPIIRPRASDHGPLVLAL